MSANPNGIRTPRPVLYERVKALRDQGLIYREIAERLGLAISTVQEAYTDPTGEAARARKAVYYGKCVDCGARTSYRSGGVAERCLACEHERAGVLEVRQAQAQRQRGRFKYTDEQIFDVLRLLAIDGRVSKTRYDKAYAASRRGAMPAMATLIFRFGSWRKAVHAAGLHVVNEGTPEEYANRASDAAILDAIDSCAAEVGHWPKVEEYEAWARREGTPTRRVLGQRFGSYWQAIEAAMARAEKES